MGSSSSCHVSNTWSCPPNTTHVIDQGYNRCYGNCPNPDDVLYANRLCLNKCMGGYYQDKNTPLKCVMETIPSMENLGDMKDKINTNNPFNNVKAAFYGYVALDKYSDAKEQAMSFCKDKKPLALQPYTRIKILDEEPSVTFTDSSGKDVQYFNVTYVDETDPTNPRNVIMKDVPSTSIIQVVNPCNMIQAAYNLEAAYITSNQNTCPYVTDPDLGTISKVMAKKYGTGGKLQFYGCFDRAKCNFPPVSCADDTLPLGNIGLGNFANYVKDNPMKATAYMLFKDKDPGQFTPLASFLK